MKSGRSSKRVPSLSATETVSKSVSHCLRSTYAAKKREYLFEDGWLRVAFSVCGISADLWVVTHNAESESFRRFVFSASGVTTYVLRDARREFSVFLLRAPLWTRSWSNFAPKRRPYAPFDDHVFISLRRKPLLINDVETAFQTAVNKIGLRRGPGLPRPTPHSLRHTFAVRALEACPDGRDRITRHMLALSTYLGHGKVCDTYWYLQATPDLMKDIADCCERFTKGGHP